MEATATARASGGRMTAQRRLVLETLQSLGGHPTAEEVYRATREHDASIHPSTVYRTLDWLEAAGLVSHRHLDAGLNDERCERFDPAVPLEHHHFVCTGCGQVIEFASPRIEEAKAEFAEKYRARVSQASLTLYGLCAECRSSRREAQAEGRRT